MGQYYYVVNIDKRQYLHPHKFGDGLKLLEFGASEYGTMLGLAVLLADGNGRGGGDLDNATELTGSWAGDRIVVAGDYADMMKYLEGFPDLIEDWKKDPEHDESPNLYQIARKYFVDISAKVVEELARDRWVKAEFLRMKTIDQDGKWKDKYS